MKKAFTLLSFVALIVIVSSCKSSGGVNFEGGTPKAGLMNTELAQDFSQNEAPPPPEQRANTQVENPTVERKIIKQGDISFETADVEKTKALITKTVDEMGGYIANDNIYNYDNRVTHRLVIRVPANKFDDLLTKIAESARKLDSKNIEVLDVTEEYIDVEARIKTKKELETRYKEILKQAKSVTDILAIEREIGTLRTDIESAEGRLKYLIDRISLSTLTVEYYELTGTSLNFFSRFGQALTTGWSWLLKFIIGVTHLWPFVLLVAGGLYLAYRFNRRKPKKK